MSSQEEGADGGGVGARAVHQVSSADPAEDLRSVSFTRVQQCSGFGSVHVSTESQLFYFDTQRQGDTVDEMNLMKPVKCYLFLVLVFLTFNPPSSHYCNVTVSPHMRSDRVWSLSVLTLCVLHEVPSCFSGDIHGQYTDLLRLF